MRFTRRTNQDAPIPLLSFDSTQEEEKEEKEEIEMESMAEQLGWKITRL